MKRTVLVIFSILIAIPSFTVAKMTKTQKQIRIKSTERIEMRRRELKKITFIFVASNHVLFSENKKRKEMEDYIVLKFNEKFEDVGITCTVNVAEIENVRIKSLENKNPKMSSGMIFFNAECVPINQINKIAVITELTISDYDCEPQYMFAKERPEVWSSGNQGLIDQNDFERTIKENIEMLLEQAAADLRKSRI